MKYYVGQVVEFYKDVFTGTSEFFRTVRVKGRIFRIHEQFAPQLDIRLEDGTLWGIMESDILRVVEIDTIKDLMNND